MLTLLLALSCRPADDPTPADLVFTGGTIFLTVDETTTSLAVRDGLVVATGADADALVDETTETVDLDGAVAYPGFTDAHVHLMPGSFVLDRILLVGVDNMTSILRSVEDYAEVAPDDEPWYVGFGWLSARFEGEPSGLAIDDIVSDKPVILVDGSGHTALVNSKAMELAGITADTPDPVGGEIIRDPDTGEPTGWLKEEALSLVSVVALEAYNDGHLGAALPEQMDNFLAAGVTGVIEIMASPGFDVARPWIYADLEAAGELPMRVHYHVPIFEVADVAEAAGLRGEYDGDMLRFTGGKVWVDGSMSNLEAWLSEPVTSDPENYGSHYFEPATLTDIARAAESEGIPLKWHVNGDAAVTATLNALEEVGAELGGLEQVHTLEHATLIDAGDYARMQTLGVVASIQPVHTVFANLGQAPAEWGPERFSRSYDYAGLHNAGVPMAMGTDWPVWPSPDPLVNIWAAVEHREDAALTVTQATDGYLSGISATLGDPMLGNLSVGSHADVVVIDRDPQQVDVNEITNLSVLSVYVAGQKRK
jgi:predicted amidohydrolase YtcJ